MDELVKIKPFGLFKLADSAIESVIRNTDDKTPPEVAAKNMHDEILNHKKSSQFIAVIPESKEMFTIIPIIKDNQLYASYFPEPIQLYFSLAFTNYQQAKKTLNTILIQSDQRKDGSALNFINSYIYNWFLKYKISSIIFMHSSIEAFMNYVLADDFIYKQELIGNNQDKYSKSIKEFDKLKTEKFIQFTEKLKCVIPQATGIDFLKDHKKIYDSLLDLNKLRNNLIHLSSKSSKFSIKHFETVFETLVNLDLLPFITNVKDFMNIISPDFIQFEKAHRIKKDVIHFKFEHQKAFHLDISAFLQILTSSDEVIILEVPFDKEDEKSFSSKVNWIFQNLDEMAKSQLIFNPEIIQYDKELLKIRVTKTNNYKYIEPI